MFKELLQLIVENVISILSLLVAFGSAWYAYRSKEIARQALIIAKKDFDNKQANFDLYLIDGYRWKDKITKKKILLFNISIKNKSETKNTFKCNLEIEYIKPNNTTTKAFFSHQPELVRSLPRTEITTFLPEIRIEEKSTESKWLVFEEPEDVFDNYRISKYILKLTDNLNNENSICTYLLKTLYD